MVWTMSQSIASHLVVRHLILRYPALYYYWSVFVCSLAEEKLLIGSDIWCSRLFATVLSSAHTNIHATWYTERCLGHQHFKQTIWCLLLTIRYLQQGPVTKCSISPPQCLNGTGRHILSLPPASHTFQHSKICSYEHMDDSRHHILLAMPRSMIICNDSHPTLLPV